MTSQIVVWRHGRTDWNATGRFQGQTDMPLDSEGVLQAKRAASVLADLPPAAIISSDLSRASQTATALSMASGVPVLLDRRLREIDVGSWEGLTWEEVRAADPDLGERLWRGEEVRRSASGESPEEVAERVAEVLREVTGRIEDGSTVVLATHGTAGRVGTCHFLGLPPQTWRAFGALHNCGWILLRRSRAGAWRIGEYNVTALDGAVG